MAGSKCPIKGCTKGRKPHQVMCKRHWFMVAPMRRSRIWQLFTERRGSREHLVELRKAIEEVNQQLDEELLTR